MVQFSSVRLIPRVVKVDRDVCHDERPELHGGRHWDGGAGRAVGLGCGECLVILAAQGVQGLATNPSHIVTSDTSSDSN